MGELVTRDGCTLRYREAGAAAGTGAETLVLLSGWSQTAAMYGRLIDELGDTYRVIAYDHRNHGESGSIDNGARIPSLAADLQEVLDHLGVEKAHLLGNSMGCSVLWSYVDLYGTGRVSSLTLIDQPSVCALVPWLAPEDAAEVGAIVDFAGAAGLVEALLGPESDEFRRTFLRSMLKPDISDADYEWLVEQNMKLRMPFGAQLILDHVLQDWRTVLTRIDVPTFVGGGELSHVDATSQRWNAAQIPGAKLHVFTADEGGDHFPFFEAPKVFAGVLLEFLESTR